MPWHARVAVAGFGAPFLVPWRRWIPHAVANACFGVWRVCVAVASVRCSWQRSSPFPRRSRLAQSGDPLLSQLPKDFLALLSEGASSNDLPRKLEARRRELRDLQDRSAVCRRARCDALHATREALARYCVTAQQQLRLRFARYVLMLALASHCASANSLSAHGTATINMRASLLWLSTSSC